MKTSHSEINQDSAKLDQHVGNRVRMRRIVMSMSQEVLAQHLGLSFQQVQKYEQGKNRISAGRLYTISRALNVPVQFFFKGIDDAFAGAMFMAEEAESHSDLQDLFRRKETLELVRSYYKIQANNVRQKVLDLIRALIADK